MREVTKELLKELYIDKNMSAKEIANYTGIPFHRIRSLIKNDRLSKDIRKESREKYNQTEITKEFLLLHFLEERMTLPEISKKFGYSKSKITKALIKFEIHKTLDCTKREEETKPIFKRLYFEDGLSISQIAERLHTDCGFITRLFKRLDIPISKNLRYERRRKTDVKSRNRIKKSTRRLIKKEFERRRNRRSGYKLSYATKQKIREKAILRKPKEAAISKIQKDARAILAKLGISFEEEYPIPSVGRFDFHLKGHHSLLEIDSRWHHSLPDIIEKDKAKEAGANRNGFKVYRVWDDKVSEEKISQILKQIRGY